MSRPPKSSNIPRRRCAYCNEPFLAYRNGGQRYCSVDCYHRASNHMNWRVDFKPNSAAETSLPTARRVAPRSVEVRRVRGSDGKGYYAVDADALLEEITESEQARPGHAHG